jgi:hypothetical protein
MSPVRSHGKRQSRPRIYSAGRLVFKKERSTDGSVLVVCRWTMKRLSHQGVLQRDQLDELRRRINSQKKRDEFWKGSILGRDIKFLLLPSPSGGVPPSAEGVELYKKLLLS